MPNKRVDIHATSKRGLNLEGTPLPSSETVVVDTRVEEKRQKRKVLRKKIGEVLNKATSYGLKKGALQEQIEFKDSVTGYSRWIDEIEVIIKDQEERMIEIVGKKETVDWHILKRGKAGANAQQQLIGRNALREEIIKHLKG